MARSINVQKHSRANLQRYLKRLGKFGMKGDEAEVEIAIDNFAAWHCVRESNILQVMKDGEIKVKNQVLIGEFTNLSTDFFQGFENHLSMSLGTPWYEYGPFAFSYGLEEIDDNSLFFCDDPWLYNGEKLQKTFLTKKDFMTLLREVARRRVVKVFKNLYLPAPFLSRRRVLEVYFKKWECKQASNLKLLDSDELIIWTQLDHAVWNMTNLFGNRLLLITASIGILLMILGSLL